MCSLFTQSVVIGYSNFYFIGIFGPREFNPTLRILLVITVHRFWLLFSQLLAFHKGEQLRSNQGFVKTIIGLVFHVGATALVIWWFKESKYLEGQNIYCQLWIVTIIIVMCIEPFYFILRTLTSNKFDELAHKAALKGDYAKVAELQAEARAVEEGLDPKNMKKDNNPLHKLGESLVRQPTENLSKSLKQ